MGALAPFSFLVQVEQCISIELNTELIHSNSEKAEHLKNENDVIIKLVYFVYLSLVFKKIFLHNQTNIFLVN